MSKNPDPIKQDTDPQVFLTAIRDGVPVYLRLVGDQKLVPILRELASQEDTPLIAEEGLLEAVGNDVFHTSVGSFVLGLRSAFTMMPQKDIKELPNLFSSETLTWSFFVSY